MPKIEFFLDINTRKCNFCANRGTIDLKDNKEICLILFKQVESSLSFINITTKEAREEGAPCGIFGILYDRGPVSLVYNHEEKEED